MQAPRPPLYALGLALALGLPIDRPAHAAGSPVDTITEIASSKGVDAAEAWALRWLKAHEGEAAAEGVIAWLDDARWQRARRANTAEAYQVYRALQPAGAHVAAARQAEGDLRCPPVLATRNLRVARELRRELPGTPCADALLVHEHALIWAEAEHDDVPAAWDALLVDYPHHPRRDEALFRRTASVDTEQAWSTYLAWAPQGPFAEEARAAAARAGCNAWLAPDNTPTLSGLADLRRRYPALPCEPALADIEAVLTWTEAAAANTPASWTSLLERFPNHPRADAARDRRSNLWWAEASQRDTETAYADLLARDPTSPHRAAILAKLIERAADSAAATGTSRAWRAFADRFPDHPLAPTARRRADILERREALSVADALTLRLPSTHAEDGSLWLDRAAVPVSPTVPSADTEPPEPPSQAEPAGPSTVTPEPAATSWALPASPDAAGGAIAAEATLVRLPDGGARLTLRLGDAGPRREVSLDAVRVQENGCGHDTGMVWTTLDGTLQIDLRAHPRCGGEDRAATLRAGTDGWRFDGMLLPGLQGP